MTSKELSNELESIVKYLCESANKQDKYALEIVNEVKKNLEILEILKYRMHLKDSTLRNDSKEFEIAFVVASGFVFKNSKEYTLLKEWLK